MKRFLLILMTLAAAIGLYAQESPSSNNTYGQPCPGTPTVTDHEGNVYNTVLIGNQCWTKENLRTTTSPSTGTYLVNNTIEEYTHVGKMAKWYNNDSVTAIANNYGLLYNWNATVDTFNIAFSETAVYIEWDGTYSVEFPTGHRQGICPTGWHVPTDAEWTQLTDYISSQNGNICGSDASYTAKALASTTGWQISANDCAVGNDLNSNNAAGFSAVPAGWFGGGYFDEIGLDTEFWSATQSSNSTAFDRFLLYSFPYVTRTNNYSKSSCYSVRCLRDETNSGSSATLPTVTTGTVSDITETSATCGGEVTSDGGSEVIERGVCWGISANPAATGAHTSDGTGTGTFTSSISGLSSGYTYTMRAYATNSVGTAYGETVTFTANGSGPGPVVDEKSCPNNTTVTDVDGNTYGTVQIGGQCWMRDNLRTTKYADGTGIALGSDTSSTVPYYYDYSSSGIPLTIRGYLYNWPAAMHGAVSSNANPSGVQGVCPTGWHLPSYAEWLVFVNYMRSQNEYQCGNDTNYIAKALTSTEWWTLTSTNCTPGNGQSTNNASGFNAVPTGGYNGSSFNGAGSSTTFQLSTEYYGVYSLGFSFSDHYSYGASGYFSYSGKYNGNPVRCLRNESSGTDTTTSQHVISISLTTDQYSDETTWQVEDLSSNTILASGGPYSETGEQDIPDIIVDGTGCYVFTIFDGYGDGICCEYGNGSYSVSYDGVVIGSGGSSFSVESYCLNPSSSSCPPTNLSLTSVDNTPVTPNTDVFIKGTVTNTGVSAITSFKVKYRVDGGEWSADDLVSCYVAASGTASFTRVSAPLALGMHTLEVMVFDPNGTADDETDNSLTVTIEISENPEADAQPCPETPTVTDIDGNVYHTVKIGEQCWMRENLRTTRYADGTAILSGDSASVTSDDTPYYYNHSYSPIPFAIRGYLYNWPAAMHGEASSNDIPSGVQGICPDGWHLPSDGEWYQLTNYLGTQGGYQCGGQVNNISKALASPEYWVNYGGDCSTGNQVQYANNYTGFSAVPAGYRDSLQFGGENDITIFWSSSIEESWTYNAWARSINSTISRVFRGSDNKYYGSSVRCLRDESIIVTLPTIATIMVSDITATTATSGGQVMSDGGAPVTARGVCWSTSQNPTISDAHTSDGTGSGIFTSSVTGLEPNTIYYLRAYATNSEGTAYGGVAPFTTEAGDTPVEHGQPCQGTPTVTDIDGNVYNTVKIGNQCWLRENMRTTHYADGTAISLIDYSSSSIPLEARGYLYDWSAAMHGSTSSSTNPSGVQGVCPNGWHLPSYAEWKQLIDYVKTQSEFCCANSNDYIAKALASTEYWNSLSNMACVPGDQSQYANNATGFSAVPAGFHNGSSFYYTGDEASFWTATEEDPDNFAWTFYFTNYYAFARELSTWKTQSYSVRCLRNVSAAACDVPHTLESDITDTSTILSWIGTQDSYTVRYRTAGSDVPIWGDDFENGLDNWTIVGGANADLVFDTYWYTINPTNVLGFGTPSGSYAATSWSYYQAPYQADNWLISPQLDLGVVAKYYVRTNPYYPDSYEVLLSTTDADTNSFNITLKPMETAPINDAWNEVVIDLSAYNGQQGRIAFHHVGYDMLYLAIDDFGVYGEEIPAGDWNSVTVSDTILSLTGLIPDAQYEWQVQGMSDFCDNGETEWSEMAMFSNIPATLPTVTTSTVSNITATTATCGGNVTLNGGAPITARGICWSTSTTPTVADNHTSDGTSMGTFTSQITGLNPGTTYYVRAYSTNRVGTAYGEAVMFTTNYDGQPCPGVPTVTDHEGNVYNTVQIGDQCWTRENLRTTTSPTTGTYLIPTASTGPTFTGKQAHWYDNDSATYAPMNYGLLYNWNAAVDTFNTAYGELSKNGDSDNAVDVTFDSPRRGICPAGWHLPSNEEWQDLTQYLYDHGEYGCEGNAYAYAKALADNTGWSSYSWGDDCVVGNNQSANNATGFTAIPAGLYDGSSFSGAGYSANFWHSSQNNRRAIYYNSGGVGLYLSNKAMGSSVRCLLNDSITAATVTTGTVSDIAATTVTCGGNVIDDGGAEVTERGVCWLTWPWSNPTLNDNDGYTIDGTGTGAFTSQIMGLTPNTTYYVRAYATNSEGTAYGEVMTFTTLCNPLEVVLTPVQVAVCEGECVFLTAIGADSYIWSTGQNGSFIMECPAVTTTYSVTGFDYYGCEGVDSVTIPVIITPQTPVVTVDNTTICNGGQVTLTVANPIADATYIWYRNGEIISDATQATHVDAPTTVGEHLYTVMAFLDFYGCNSEISEPTVVMVNATNNTEFSETACDSYEWNGETFTTSGDYTRTLTNANDCDSVVTLHLTVNYGTHDVKTEIACESYEWHGVTYTTSGTYTYEYTNADGCTSVDTLHLTVNYGTHNVETEVACESYEWHGATYTTSDTYTYEYTNADGCASIDTLHLTVNYGTHNVETEVACESYEWHGVTYTTSGTYTYEYTNTDGCASVDTLILTVNYGTHNVETEVACESYEWHGVTYTMSGTYSYEYTNTDGCASVDTLTLTVNYSSAGDTTATAYDSFNWYEFTNLTMSGDYTHTFTNQNGCDSVVTLHLTIIYTTIEGDSTTVWCDIIGLYENTSPTNLIISDVTETENDTVKTQFSWTQMGDPDHWDILYVSAGGNIEQGTAIPVYSNPCILTDLPVEHSLDFYVRAVCDEGGVSQWCGPVTYPIVVVEDTVVAEGFFIWNGMVFVSDTVLTYTIPSSESYDSVVTYHIIVTPTPLTVFTIDTCDNYTLNGEIYSTSGNYVQTFPISGGIDSVVVLYLTINQSTVGVDVQIACDSYTWIDGITYTESNNTATYTLTNTAGCDSVVTLNLTLNHSETAEFSETVCNSYNWDGDTLTETGDYTRTLTNANGCDSVVTLHLTVNQPTTSTDVQTACDSFTWIDGITYTESNSTASYTLTNAAGCDSVVTLNLTLNHTQTVELAETACESYVWNDSIYTESGDYVMTFSNTAGCDSIVTLHLTVNHGSHNLETEAACESYEWHGVTYTTSGTYTYEYTNAVGCASVDTLMLTVNYDISSEVTITTEDSCYVWNTETYCASGDYTQTFQTVYGCDSVVTLHLTVSVGIDNYEGFDFKVYPNPTEGIVNVQCTLNNEQAEAMEFRVYDAYGKLVDAIKTMCTSSQQTAQIDLSQFANGVYFVKAVINGNMIAVRKVVKN